MANEPGSQEPQVAETSKPRGFFVKRVTAVAVLVGAVALTAGVTYVTMALTLTPCRRVPIPAKDGVECLDSPPGCSDPIWDDVAGCSIVVKSTCTCFEGQAKSCVVGDTGFPKQICTPGSATCGVKYCVPSGTSWAWESTCHAFP
jgi:hypothetical protein